MIEGTPVMTRYTDGVEWCLTADPTIADLSPVERDQWARRWLRDNELPRREVVLLVLRDFRHGTATKMVVRTFNWRNCKA